MPALTSFISACKTLDLRNILINDLGANLITQAVADACSEYSDYNPRGYRIATITVNIGDTEILLPTDCRSIDDSTAYLLYYGESQPKFDAPGSFPLRKGYSGSDRNSALYNSTDLASATSNSDPADIQATTNTSGRLEILLPSAATTERSHVIRYEATHSITNSPDVNTIPAYDQRKVRKLVLGYLADARRREALREGNLPLAREFERAANEYFAIREEFNGALGGIY